MGFTKVKISCEIILSVLLVDRKYHHVEKKRKLWKRRNSQLRARLEVSTFLQDLLFKITVPLLT